MPTTHKTYDPDDAGHLQDYIGIIIRRRTAFLIAFFTVFLIVTSFTFLMRPVFEANATLHVKEEKGKLSLLEELTLNPPNPIDAEIEILKSRTNAEKVVKRLHLDVRVAKRSDGITFRLIELSSSRETSYYQIDLTGKDTFTVKDDKGALVADGKSGVLLQAPDLTMLIDRLSGKTGDGIRLELLSFSGAVKNLRENVKAYEAGRKTNIITLSYGDTDPERARDVVNTLVQVYLEQSISFKTEEASRTVSFVEEQLENVRKELEIAEQNLQAYKSSAGVVLLDTEAEELVKKFSLTEKERAEITLLKKQAEFALDSLREAMKKGHTYSPAVMRNDPLVAEMAEKLSGLEVQKRALLTDYTEAHPAVRNIQEQINELERKIQTTYETSLENLAKQEETVTRHLSRYEGELKKLPSRERELARLTRISKVNADIYTFLLQKHEEARIAKASTISNISIVDPAITPEQPVRPNKPFNVILGLIVGAMLGIGFALFQEYLDNTIKDADMARRELGLPLLSVIPFIPVTEGAEKEQNVFLVAHREPKSSISEFFRSLRTSIHFSAVNKKRQIMMITSAFPGEGKTTIIGNLSVVLGQAGARVLIIDCDLRRPALHKLFSHNKVPGLTEILAGDTGVDAIIHATPIPKVDFISAGTTPPNPSELLGSDNMRNLLNSLRERYDVILLDTPPVLAVTDALLLASMTDLVMVAVEPGRVPIKAARHIREMLGHIGAPLAGIVLNDKTESSRQQYAYYGDRYYRYVYYGYGYYGEETAGEKKKKEQKPWWKRILKR